jgi:Flp pilus assembly protein TadG
MVGSGHWLKAFGRSQRASALLELTLVMPILLSIMFGIVDFGIFFTQTLGAADAANIGAHYASTHPSAWSYSDPAPSNTIEGQIQTLTGTTIPNKDANISISYLVPGSGTATNCGHYSVSSKAFVAESGYSQSTCVVPGNLIQVQLTYTYTFLTPYLAGLYPHGLSMTVTGSMIEEQ